MNAFLSFPRDEDSRSDIWSVEVLASDSEPPDIQSDVRLQELESESVVAVSQLTFVGYSLLNLAFKHTHKCV